MSLGWGQSCLLFFLKRYIGLRVCNEDIWHARRCRRRSPSSFEPKIVEGQWEVGAGMSNEKIQSKPFFPLTKIFAFGI